MGAATRRHVQLCDRCADFERRVLELEVQLRAACDVAPRPATVNELPGATMLRACGGEASVEPVPQMGFGLIPVDACLPEGRRALIVQASPEEMAAHSALLERLGDDRIWRDVTP